MAGRRGIKKHPRRGFSCVAAVPETLATVAFCGPSPWFLVSHLSSHRSRGLGEVWDPTALPYPFLLILVFPNAYVSSGVTSRSTALGTQPGARPKAVQVGVAAPPVVPAPRPSPSPARPVSTDPRFPHSPLPSTQSTKGHKHGRGQGTPHVTAAGWRGCRCQAPGAPRLGPVPAAPQAGLQQASWSRQ